MGHQYYTPSTKLRDQCEKGDRKIVKNQKVRRSTAKEHLLGILDPCKHELTTAFFFANPLFVSPDSIIS